MKNIYFVQADVSACSGTKNSYLPYTAGILIASAWTSQIVRDNFCFKGFLFLREDVKKVVERLEDPAYIGFSNYCWSTEYNKCLASAVKEKFPDCVINFGGHNVPDNFSNRLRSHIKTLACGCGCFGSADARPFHMGYRSAGEKRC